MSQVTWAFNASYMSSIYLVTQLKQVTSESGILMKVRDCQLISSDMIPAQYEDLTYRILKNIDLI